MCIKGIETKAVFIKTEMNETSVFFIDSQPFHILIPVSFRLVEANL